MARIYDRITAKEPISKGWSGDEKYRITDDQGRTYLLRVSPAERYEQKLRHFHSIQRVAQLGIPMCEALEFGRCEGGVYSIQRWIDGNDAEDVIPSLSPEQRYTYGLNAGQILKKIHTLPAPADEQSWSDRYGWKIDRKIAMYESCPLKYENGEAFLKHIARTRHILNNRPQTYQHGDYHIGNMMIDANGTLTIIDFERDDYGDPWEEFNRIVWCAQAAPHFAAGMVDGYFDADVPQDFWELLALYICTNTLSSLPWAIPFGQREITTMRVQAAEVLQWYDAFQTVIPSWYRQK